MAAYHGSYDLDDVESVPGTYHILADASSSSSILKTITGSNGEQIRLVPQPSDSPNDPLNWSPFRKYWHMILVCFMAGFTAATSNDAGSAQDSMNQELGISWDAMNTAAGVLFVGIGCFCFLLSPSSFLYGRKISYILCTVVGLGGSVWFALTQTTADSVWNQLFVGASEAAAEAQVQLSLSDIFFQHQQGTAISFYILATSVGTYAGPLISGYMADGPGWRWIAWWGVIISGGYLIFLIFTFQETYFDRDHYERQQRQKSLQLAAGLVVSDENKEKSCDIEKTAHHTTIQEVEPEAKQSYWKSIAIITPAVNLKGFGVKQYIQRLWLTLRVLCFPPVIYAGIQWGFQDIFLSFYMTTMAEDWIEPPYNYSNSAVGLMNVPLIIGAVFGCLYGGPFSDKFVHYYATKYKDGLYEPEYRLYLLFLTSVIGPVGLLMFGIGTAHYWNWVPTYFGLGFIGFGWGCAGDLSMSYLMDAYPEMVLEGMVGVSAINNGLACVFTFVCSLWLEQQGTLKTYIALGIISFIVFMLTIPMIYYGKACRRRTKGMYIEFLRRRDGVLIQTK